MPLLLPPNHHARVCKLGKGRRGDLRSGRKAWRERASRGGRRPVALSNARSPACEDTHTHKKYYSFEGEGGGGQVLLKKDNKCAQAQQYLLQQ